MTLIELNNYIKNMIDAGEVNSNLPVKFRGDGGNLYSIDYAVMSNDGKEILFSEEWF